MAPRTGSWHGDEKGQGGRWTWRLGREKQVVLVPDRIWRSESLGCLAAAWNLASSAMFSRMVQASSYTVIVVCGLCDFKVRFKGTDC